MPGAWPAHVLMATTSGRSSFPDAPRETGDTPLDPASRDGSAGAFFSASNAVSSTDRPLPQIRPFVVINGIADHREDDDGDEKLCEPCEFHCCTSLHRFLLLRSLLRRFARFDCRKLLFGLDVTNLIAQTGQPGVERRIRNLFRQIRLG